VKHGPVYANIADADEVFTIGMNRAVEVLAQKATRGRGTAAAAPLRELGMHPDGGVVQVMPGKYGPYVKWEKVNATLPKGLSPETVTLDEALLLVAEKASKGGKARPARKATPKVAAKKSVASKPAARKPAASKPSAKKAAAGKPAARKPASKAAPEAAES
jgi:DNA topoisomerase-1